MSRDPYYNKGNGHFFGYHYLFQLLNLTLYIYFKSFLEKIFFIFYNFRNSISMNQNNKLSGHYKISYQHVPGLIMNIMYHVPNAIKQVYYA